LDQWIKRIQQFTNLTKGEIGVVQGETCQWNRPFIVAMVSLPGAEKLSAGVV